MREIKFRAWDKRKNVYIYDGMEYAIAVMGIVFPEPSEVLPIGYSSTEFEYFDIEQFTGLRDKNEKEVWEGDVYLSTYRAGGAGSIRGRYKERIKHIVEWNDRGSWRGKRLEDGHGYGCCHPDCELGEDVEVIGNIHESKELLA